MISKSINTFFNPEQFQGWGKSKKYFEGWYFKIIDSSEKYAFAIIPGIAYDEEGNGHAFIQVLDGKKQTSTYNKFDKSKFKPSRGSFDIYLSNNHFSENRMIVDLDSIKIDLQFEGNVPWPKPWYSPGIMGPYAFVPKMECYHGIVSMDHQIKGEVEYEGEHINFDNGRGYIEKDWGRSFPEAYTWMQTNHFDEPGISIKASVAKIPWLGNSFVGFIAGLWIKNKLYRFTTYNSTKLKTCEIDQEKVIVNLENRKYILEIHANRNNSSELASPIMGAMSGKIEESMTASIEIVLKSKKNNEIIYSGTGRNAGLEVAGKIEEIVT